MRKEATQKIIARKDGKELGRFEYHWIGKQSIRVTWAETHDPHVWKYLMRQLFDLPWVQLLFHHRKTNRWRTHWRWRHAFNQAHT